MVKVMDIMEEIERTLRVMFPRMERVHLERIRAIKEPSLSIEIITYRAPVLDQYVTRKIVDVEIIYFSKDNSVAEALAMQDELMRAFSLGLKVKDRFLHMGEPAEGKMIDQDLHYLMQFDFYDDLNPLIATRYEHTARPDVGATSIDNIIGEKEVEPDRWTFDEEDDDSYLPEDDPTKREEKPLADKLEYMEVLKMDYELKG